MTPSETNPFDPATDPWDHSAWAARQLAAPWLDVEPDPVDEANEVAIDHDPYEALNES